MSVLGYTRILFVRMTSPVNIISDNIGTCILVNSTRKLMLG
jgi:hypothetical protein